MQNLPGLQRSTLYARISEALAKRIATGVWKPGAILPSEQELAQEFGVSHGTMRKALNRLEEDRLLVRKQGRGTFVIDHTSAENILRFINLRNSNGERIAGVGEMLAQTVRPVTAEEEERLQVGASELVACTKRLRKHQGRPLLVEERCLALSRFPGLGASAPGDYQIIVLAQKCGLHLGKAIERVNPSKATPELAKLLSIDVGAMLLKLDRVIYSGDGLPVERRIASCHLKDEFYFAEIQ
jgi:GntR family transcriptional regulator